MAIKAADKNGEFEMERFVTVWQKARTFQEVVHGFPGHRVTSLSQRAVHLRKKGVPMKKFRTGGTRWDYAKLRELAKKLEPK